MLPYLIGCLINIKSINNVCLFLAFEKPTYCIEDNNLLNKLNSVHYRCTLMYMFSLFLPDGKLLEGIISTCFLCGMNE